MLTRLQAVLGAAIRALGMAFMREVEKHLGMGVPQLHVRLGVGTKHAAMAVEVFGQQLDGLHVKPWSTNGRTWGCGR